MPNLKKECPVCASEKLTCFRTQRDFSYDALVAPIKRLYQCEACGKVIMVDTPLSTAREVKMNR